MEGDSQAKARMRQARDSPAHYEHLPCSLVEDDSQNVGEAARTGSEVRGWARMSPGGSRHYCRTAASRFIFTLMMEDSVPAPNINIHPQAICRNSIAALGEKVNLQHEM